VQSWHTEIGHKDYSLRKAGLKKEISVQTCSHDSFGTSWAEGLAKMKREWKVKIVLLSAMLAVTIVPCYAGELLTFTGGTFGPSVNNQTIGWSFTVNTALQVGDLTWYDPTGTNPIDHNVAIWDSNGNVVVTGCAGPGCGSSWIGGFWVTTVSAALAPGNYVIGGYIFANGSDGFVFGSPTITTDPRITYGQSLFNVSSVLTEPSNHCCGNGFFGPDLSTVPEPASMTLAGLGIGIAGLWKRLRR
jgi:hypothetical protein